MANNINALQMELIRDNIQEVINKIAEIKKIKGNDNEALNNVDQYFKKLLVKAERRVKKESKGGGTYEF